MFAICELYESIISNGFDNNININSAKANSLLRVHANSTGELSPNSHAWSISNISLDDISLPKNNTAGVFRLPEPSTGTGQFKEFFEMSAFQNAIVV